MKEVTIAFVVLQLAYSVVKAQVSISTYPVPLHVTVGTSFTLSCNYNHHSFVSWQHPSLGVVSQTTGHVTLHVLDDAAVATLIVSDASPNRDEGRYTCTARSNTGVMVTQSVQAELYHAVRITTPSNQVFMALQGDVATVSLPCAAVNHSQIAWRRAGVSTELRNTSDGHLVVLPDRLVINNVRFSDNGTYECTASNRVGHESILSHLNVHVSAGVTASPVSSMVAEGSPAEFVFTVTGNPLPNVEWYKDTIGDDFRITPSPSHLESVLTDSITSVYRLRFSSVRSQDTGTYICQVHNQFGVPVSAQITLQLSDALGPPQQVRATLLRQTSINVTWSRPDGADMVDSYTVVWQSRNESPKSYVIGGDVLFYVINEGLTRLTQYTVYVYASNSRGKGSDSQRVNITTDAIAPAAPLEVNVMDIGPTSVRLEWRFGDNGGAPIIGIHVTFVTLGSDMEFVDIEISPGQTSALIPDLKDSHQYVLSLQAKNRIGLSPSLDSAVFRTAPPGRPGSPSHVTGTWVSGDQTALVCWEPSEVGQPFLSYTIEVLELKSNVTKIWKLSVDVVKDNLPNCTAGYSVTGLIIGVCYRFKVVVSNSQGTGFPSAYSEDFCVPSVDSQGMQSGSGQPLLTKYIVAIAVSLPVVVLVGAGLIIMWCICVRVRHNRSTAKLPTGPLPPDRRSSERSNQMLIDPSFHHQISIGSYTSSGSGNSVSGGEETPNTAATMLSENPFTFDSVVNSRNQLSSTFTQQDYPQSSSASRPHRSGSATLPAMNGSALPPIPEHATTPSHTLPFHATPPQYPYPNEHPPSYPSYFPTPPSSMGPGLQENFEEEVEMTDNPLNIEFEKKMLAGGNPSRPNYSHEIDLPEDEPPPYVPPYRGDDMESEMSIPIGESCSQPPRSPQLSYQQHNNSRNRTNHDRSALGLNRDHNVMTPASFNISCSDNEEEESEFFDNEAYQKVQESQFIGGGGFGSQKNVLGSSRCSPVVTMEGGYGSQQRMIEDNEGESSKPRFKIRRSARRGEVFEKVELRH